MGRWSSDKCKTFCETKCDALAIIIYIEKYLNDQSYYYKLNTVANMFDKCRLDFD